VRSRRTSRRRDFGDFVLGGKVRFEKLSLSKRLILDYGRQILYELMLRLVSARYPIKDSSHVGRESGRFGFPGSVPAKRCQEGRGLELIFGMHIKALP
jgi:hypothetical protein